MIREFCLSLKVMIQASNESFWLTTVYDPTTINQKEAFYTELLTLKPQPGEGWLVCGDFNHIHRARDKNKLSFNRRTIIKLFHDPLSEGGLKEIHV